jgi:predicted  nucleic acid-binding Zn-ribbon protein
MKEPKAGGAGKMTGQKRPKPEAVVTSLADSQSPEEFIPRSKAGRDAFVKNPENSKRPIILAIAASLIWAGASIYLVSIHEMDWAETGLTIQDITLMVTGFMTPFIAIWLITLIFMRSSPLRDQHAALVLGLEGLLDPVNIAERRIDQLIEKLQKQINDVNAASDAATEKLMALESQFIDQTEKLHNETAVTENRTVAIRETLARERQAIQTLNSEMEHRTTEIHKMVEDLSESLRTAASDARAQMRDSEVSLAQNTALLTEEAGLAKANLEALTLSLEDCSNRLGQAGRQSNDTLTRVQDINQQLETSREAFENQAAAINIATQTAESRIEQMNALMAEAAQAVEIAAASASAAADTANQSLGAQSEKLAAAAHEIEKSADELLAHSNRFESKVTAKGGEDFAKSSSFLIESLASQAIDIHRVLDTDIPDTVWQKYLKGDRSVFARRAVRLANSQTKNLIVRKFREDSEFRDHAQRFIREFEKLIAHAITADPSGPLSITLISSEMGKLYVLLAQSLNRLS